MPNKDERVRAVAKKGKNSTAGRMRVGYRGVKGITADALVLDAGTTSGLKLKLLNRAPNLIIDNVPAATTLKQTGAYFSK